MPLTFRPTVGRDAEVPRKVIRIIWFGGRVKVGFRWFEGSALQGAIKELVRPGFSAYPRTVPGSPCPVR